MGVMESSGAHIPSPGVPEGRVVLCAVSAAREDLHKMLEARGVSVLSVGKADCLPSPTASHPDLLLHPLGNGVAVVAKGQDRLQTDLERHGFQVVQGESPLGKSYPRDIPLNCLPLNGLLFCLPAGLDPALHRLYRGLGYRLRPVKQGYTRCSTLVVDKRSGITSDSTIHRALLANGLDCLLIRPGHIRLAGYEYGFLGGCGGLLDRNHLAFTGDVASHPDWKAIHRFCWDRGVEAECLSNGPLEDVGGILPLLQVPKEGIR